mgnify:CR=1 FL=1
MDQLLGNRGQIGETRTLGSDVINARAHRDLLADHVLGDVVQIGKLAFLCAVAKAHQSGDTGGSPNTQGEQLTIFV